MSDKRVQRESDLKQLAAELRERAEKERASGGYADDLSSVELEVPRRSEQHEPLSITRGFDLDASGPRVRFRPELGFSSKPVVGPAITLVKRAILRLQLYVFDDLARQTDTAIARVEAALAVEIAARDRLEGELEALEVRLARLEQSPRSSPPPTIDR
jgi:hypothetical protein